MSNFLNSLKYIDWQKEATRKVLTWDEISALYEQIKLTGNQVNEKTLRAAYEVGDYYLERKGTQRRLYLFKENGCYEVYSTNMIDDEKNDVENRLTGTKAIKLFFDKFRELENVGRKGFSGAFGTSENDILNCIPKEFYFVNMEKRDRLLKCYSSIDFCSHYPSSSLGDLPDANTAIKVKGYKTPNSEYPFAFYPTTGNFVEYKKVNTFMWKESIFAPWMFKNNKNGKIKEEKYTILMKKSCKTLDKTFSWFYNRRKDKEEYKVVMNATIGMFHRKKYDSYKYAHIATVALARANQKILDLAEEIGYDNILQICVDGIIYRGKYEYGEKDKALGKIYQEFTNCDIKLRGMNCYIAKDKQGNVVKVRHGAFNKNSDGSDIEKEKVKDFNEMYQWIRLNPLEGW